MNWCSQMEFGRQCSFIFTTARLPSAVYYSWPKVNIYIYIYIRFPSNIKVNIIDASLINYNFVQYILTEKKLILACGVIVQPLVHTLIIISTLLYCLTKVLGYCSNCFKLILRITYYIPNGAIGLFHVTSLKKTFAIFGHFDIPQFVIYHHVQ